MGHGKLSFTFRAHRFLSGNTQLIQQVGIRALPALMTGPIDQTQPHIIRLLNDSCRLNLGSLLLRFFTQNYGGLQMLGHLHLLRIFPLRSPGSRPDRPRCWQWGCPAAALLSGTRLTIRPGISDPPIGRTRGPREMVASLELPPNRTIPPTRDRRGSGCSEHPTAGPGWLTSGATRRQTAAPANGQAPAPSRRGASCDGEGNREV
jgi:hypothetical protein